MAMSNSSEQLIQHQKAKLFGGNAAAEKIMSAKMALECKRISKDITNYDNDKWKTEAKTRCEEGIKVKFMQNSGLRLYLLNTGNKRIVESCADKLWGTGIPIHDKNCLDPSYWNFQGILGEILENTRSNIRDIIGINSNLSPNRPDPSTTPPTMESDIIISDT